MPSGTFWGRGGPGGSSVYHILRFAEDDPLLVLGAGLPAEAAYPGFEASAQEFVDSSEAEWARDALTKVLRQPKPLPHLQALPVLDPRASGAGYGSFFVCWVHKGSSPASPRPPGPPARPPSPHDEVAFLALKAQFVAETVSALDSAGAPVPFGRLAALFALECAELLLPDCPPASSSFPGGPSPRPSPTTGPSSSPSSIRPPPSGSA